MKAHVYRKYLNFNNNLKSPKTKINYSTLSANSIKEELAMIFNPATQLNHFSSNSGMTPGCIPFYDDNVAKINFPNLSLSVIILSFGKAVKEIKDST